MRLSRRDFMVGSGALLVGAGLARADAAATAKPSATVVVDPHTEEQLIGVGLDAAKRAGAEYADVRIERIRTQSLQSRDDYVLGVQDRESYGVAVRVIVDGTWGFAASWVVDAVAVARAAKAAVDIARANRKLRATPDANRVDLGKRPGIVGKWSSPHEVDPFDIPIGEKAALLAATGKRALAAATGGRKLIVTGDITFTRQEKLFGSTEGTLLRQVFLRGQPSINVSAIDEKKGAFELADSDSLIPAQQIGWEVTKRNDLGAVAVKVAERAQSRLGAAPLSPGKYDLVIAPSNLWLTIHESVGHPTELDRMLGYEANFAGTSFCKPSDIGQLRYGSEHVSIVADRTQPGALGSCGWDDDGVAGDQWDLIRDGVFVGVQTTREQANWIPGAQAHAGSYAQSWADVPFQRMPNVSLQPGKKDLTPQQLIADTQRGIYVEGNGSWSIDHQRYNFQFTAQAFTLIEKGKLVRPVSKIAYQSNSLDFWRSCDAICDKRDYSVNGALHDGKGEPEQSNPVSHGAATARFRNVNVLAVGV